MDNNSTLVKAVRTIDLKDAISLGTVLVAITVFGVTASGKQDLTNQKLDSLSQNIVAKDLQNEKRFDAFFLKQTENSDDIIRIKSKLGLASEPQLSPASISAKVTQQSNVIGLGL